MRERVVCPLVSLVCFAFFLRLSSLFSTHVHTYCIIYCIRRIIQPMATHNAIIPCVHTIVRCYTLYAEMPSECRTKKRKNNKPKKWGKHTTYTWHNTSLCVCLHAMINAFMHQVRPPRMTGWLVLQLQWGNEGKEIIIKNQEFRMESKALVPYCTVVKDHYKELD